MARAPNLQDIADRAGVSKNTVSGALRNRPGFSSATCARIQQLAREMGYRSNPMISALMRSVRQAEPATQRGNIAYLHGSHSEQGWQEQPFSRAMFDGARERAGLLGFHLEPVWWAEPGMTGARLSGILRARGVEGVIIGPMPGIRGHLRLEWSHFALATIGFSLWRPALHRVATHHYHIMTTVGRNLRKLGYRRIGVALSPNCDARLDYAWQAGLARLAASRAKPLLLPLLLEDAPTYDTFHKWMRRHKPDVMVNGGAGVEAHLQRMGLRAPEDIGVVSLLADGGPTDPATVWRPWRALGAVAMDLVAGQLIRNERGLPPRPQTVLIEGDWDPGCTVRRQQPRPTE